MTTSSKNLEVVVEYGKLSDGESGNLLCQVYDLLLSTPEVVPIGAVPCPKNMV